MIVCDKCGVEIKKKKENFFDNFDLIVGNKYEKDYTFCSKCEAQKDKLIKKFVNQK